MKKRFLPSLVVLFSFSFGISASDACMGKSFPVKFASGTLKDSSISLGGQGLFMGEYPDTVRCGMRLDFEGGWEFSKDAHGTTAYSGYKGRFGDSDKVLPKANDAFPIYSDDGKNPAGVLVVTESGADIYEYKTGDINKAGIAQVPASTRKPVMKLKGWLEGGQQRMLLSFLNSKGEEVGAIRNGNSGTKGFSADAAATSFDPSVGNIACGNGTAGCGGSVTIEGKAAGCATTEKTGQPTTRTRNQNPAIQKSSGNST